jgi:hypothetical protein
MWYVAMATGHFGYPQPEDEYQHVTYDGSRCERCAIGGNQVEPFRFRSEPKAKHSQFLQLNWVFDELFVHPEVVEAFQAYGITGVEFGSVLHHRSGEPIASRMQLHIRTLLPPALLTAGLRTVTCRPNNEESHVHIFAGEKRYPPDYPYCDRVKYHWHAELTLRSEALSNMPDLVKTSEWFGSGGQAFRAILVSKRAADLINSRRWRGLRLTPVNLVNGPITAAPV